MCDDGNPIEGPCPKCITTTGLWGAERAFVKLACARLGVAYSGSLALSSTAVLVVPARGAADESWAASDKALAARKAGIPCVSLEWLQESAAEGKLLPWEGYAVGEPYNATGGRRSTAESAAPPPPAERLRSAPAASPPVEPLPLFVDGSPQRAAPPAKEQQQPEAVEPLESPPAAPAAQPSASAGGAAARQRAMDAAWRRVESAALGSAPRAAGLAASGGSRMPTKPPRSPSPPAPPLLPASAASARGALTRRDGAALASVTAFHRLSAADAAGVVFFAAVEVTPAAAPPAPPAPLTFAAGDGHHGARILYDVDAATGRRTYARILVRCIYTLPARGGCGASGSGGGSAASGSSSSGPSRGGSGGPGTPAAVWLLHHYLLSRGDVESRPAWAAAYLPRHALRGDDWLVSTGWSHSPARFVVGDFGACYPRGGGAGGGGGVALAPGAAVRLPLLGVVGALNPATGRRAHLPSALAGMAWARA